MERAEVVIVGAGLLGAAAARALGARGVGTVVLEQFALGHDRGSSHGATRIFRLSYPEPDYVRMAMLAQQGWRRLADECGEELLVRTGGLDAGPDAVSCAEALAACGARFEWLDAGAVRERFGGGIAVTGGERMLWQPDSGALLADRAVAALQRLAMASGADFRAGTPVLKLERAGGRVAVHTAAGSISAGVAVVAAGGWAGGLLGGVLPTVPRLTVTLQQSRYYTPRDPGVAWPTIIEWNPDGPVWYVVPSGGVAPGVKAASHDRGRAVDAGAGPFAAEPESDAQAAAYVRERLPGLDPAGFGTHTCLYTMTPDQDFVLDRSGPLVVGGGGSGHAFKFGPLLGEVLADLVQGRPAAVPSGRFALTRPR